MCDVRKQEGGECKAQPTVDRFSHHVSNWEKWLNGLADGREINCLEVGSREGMSALWIAQNLLIHNPRSRLFCTDTWAQHGESSSRLYREFSSNLSEYMKEGRVIAMRGESDKVLCTIQGIVMQGKIPQLDLVYVGGSRDASGVLSDMIMSYHLLKAGGAMIVDNHEWNAHADLDDALYRGVDSFIACFGDKCDLISRGSQVFIRKNDQ